MSASGRLLPVTEMISSIGEGPLLGESRHSSKEFICSVRPSLNDRFRLLADLRSIGKLSSRQAQNGQVRKFVDWASIARCPVQCSDAVAGNGHRKHKAHAQPIACMGNGRSHEWPHSLRCSKPEEAPTKSRKITEPWQDCRCQPP